MTPEIKPGQEYVHFKGGRYIIVAVATDANTMCKVVIYQHVTLPEARLWTRPLSNFLEMVTINKVDTPRFSLVPGVVDSVSGA